MDLLIRNGLILALGQSPDYRGDVLIRNNRISRIGQDIDFAGESDISVIDATGLVVAPGFLDLHCHLREPGFEEKETIATGTRAAACGGFATVCCMPNTEPAADSPEVIKRILDATHQEGTVWVLPIGCVTEGRKGNRLAKMVHLKRAGAVAFSDDGSPVWNYELMRLALEQSRKSGVPIIDHCEDPLLFNDGAMNDGAVSAELGYRGILAAAEERMVARDIDLAKKTGGHVHIAHVSTAGSVELIRQAKKDGVRVTAEVTPHHLTLTEEEVRKIGAQAKVNPPLRTPKDIDALIEGLIDGTIDAIATDHAPHTKADKSGNFQESAFGFSGFETAFGSLMTLVHSGKMDLKTLISKLTVEPAGILDVPGITGKLADGGPADIVVFDPERVWIVDPSQFLSKGRNTPLAGATLKGKVLLTVSRGQIAYRDPSL